MGLLQTAFIASFMIFAPLFGYLGDRYSRKAIMAAGVFLWSVFTLIGSFITSKEENRALGWSNPDYWSFLACRAMVGIGEASYSTIAPTIISDMFVKNMRSKMLALFYFAIPVGSGLGYIVGSETAEAFGSWQWGLRATPIAGAAAVIAMLIAGLGSLRLLLPFAPDRLFDVDPASVAGPFPAVGSAGSLLLDMSKAFGGVRFQVCSAKGWTHESDRVRLLTKALRCESYLYTSDK